MHHAKIIGRRLVTVVAFVLGISAIFELKISVLCQRVIRAVLLSPSAPPACRKGVIYLGTTYERLGIVVFDFRLRHLPRHVAARPLPEQHLGKDSQDVVRLGVGLSATIAALVLGLLIAAAKSSFDTQSTQIKQITDPAGHIAQLKHLIEHPREPDRIRLARLATK